LKESLTSEKRGTSFKAAVADGVCSRLTKEELRAMLGNPDVVIIDMRTGKDWKASQSKRVQ